MKPFGTCIIDPPWPYGKTSGSHKLTGYADKKYQTLSLEDLSLLPIFTLVDYVFLWSTPPFQASAWELIKNWGFTPITTLYWIKADEIIPGTEPAFKPSYGVGYWFRGCVEPIIVGKAIDVASIRTHYVGLISQNAKHSRKPDTLYEIVETKFPGPYLELFGRRNRPNWTVLGNEATDDGLDVRISIQKLLK